MLYDLIRDFFVTHIFGGYASDTNFYDVLIGYDQLEWGDEVTNNQLFYQVGLSGDGGHINISLGDWLSTTATIITITLIVLACALFVYKIIRTIGGLIR